MTFLFVVLVVVVLAVRWRMSRRETFSGLNAERPVFHVDPPTRRLGSRKGERL